MNEEINLKELAERDTKNLLCRIALRLWKKQNIPLYEIRKRLEELQGE